MISRKKWSIVMAVVVLAFVGVLLFLSLYGGQDNYRPMTNEPEVIFHQACVRCHSEKGVGGQGIGPRLAGKVVPPDEVREHVQKGKGRMPRFPNIRGEALENLAGCVHGL